jgi:hypothetical protein
LTAIKASVSASAGLYARPAGFDFFVLDAIRHDVRVLPNNEFPASGKPSKASDLGFRRQHLNLAANFAYDAARCGRVVFRDVIMEST